MKLPLVNSVLSLFDDARWYLERLDETAYCHPHPRLSGATIGGHTRHFIEFIQCLVEKLHPDFMQEDLVLNYDHRRRNRSIETSPRQALAVLEVLADQLSQLNCDETIWVEHTDYQADRTCLIATSPERELLYNIEHIIHHFALIRIGLNVVTPDLTLPAHFGVAPSTLQHRSATAMTSA